MEADVVTLSEALLAWSITTPTSIPDALGVLAIGVGLALHFIRDAMTHAATSLRAGVESCRATAPTACQLTRPASLSPPDDAVAYRIVETITSDPLFAHEESFREIETTDCDADVAGLLPNRRGAKPLADVVRGYAPTRPFSLQD